MFAKRSSALLLLSALSACAAKSQGPFFDDQQYLTFGVDPKTEARAVARDLENHGLAAEPVVQGNQFYALGVRHPDLTCLGVRVITVRGIALALDRVKPTIFQDEVLYRLLPPPWPDTQDADGDGREEVFVEVQRSGRAGTTRCISAYRIGESGAVEAVDGNKLDLGTLPPGRELAWRRPTFCELELPEPASPGPDAGAPTRDSPTRD